MTEKKVKSFIVLITVLLIFNVLSLHLAIIGIITFITWLIIAARSLSKIYKPLAHGNTWYSGFLIAGVIILINLVMVYFIRYIWWINIVLPMIITGCLILINKPELIEKHTEDQAESGTVESKKRIIKIIYITVFSLVIVGLVWLLIRIRMNGEVSNGTLPSSVQIPQELLYLALLLIMSGILFVKRSKLLIISIIVLTLVTSSVYFFGVKRIYDADGWRHLSIERYVSTGQPYQPTDLFTLLKFKSEKLPNGLLYTIVPTINTVTQVEIEAIHKYWSLLLIALVIYSVYVLLRNILTTRKSLVAISIIIASSGFQSIGWYSNPQSLGLATYLISLLLFGVAYYRPNKMLWPLLVITSILSILAYPTTSYYTICLLSLVLFTRTFGRFINRFTLIAFVAVFSILLAWPLYYIDTAIMRVIPINDSIAVVMQNIWNTIKTLTPSSGSIFNFIPWIISFIWFIQLFRRRQYKILLIALTLLFAIFINVGMWPLFSAKQSPMFLARVYNVFYLTLYLYAGIGMAYMFEQKLFKKSKIVKITSILMLATLYSINVNFNARNFSWSPTTNELTEIDSITSYANKFNITSYKVLADEPTSTAGNALTGFLSGHYYWFSGEIIAENYWYVIQNPTITALQQVCTNLNTGHVFFIDTQIPPNDGYRKNIIRLESVMDKISQHGNAASYVHNCFQKI